MSELRIYPEDRMGAPVVLTDHREIARRLAEIDVLFERWEASEELDEDASHDEIIEAYREDIDRLMQRYGFKSLDVISIRPEHPKRSELRDKLLREHTHAESEMRFFADGEALFYIRKNGRVFGVLCGRGDLVSVPANTAHWFDMGEEPHLKMVRLFTSEGGGLPVHFTGNRINERFPRLEALYHSGAD